MNQVADGQSEYWCFTVNNPSSDDLEALTVSSLSNVPDYRYLVYQMEKGENDTVHAQGYIEFKKGKKKRLSFMKARFTDRFHFEMRRGTRTQARDYCMKVESRLDPNANPVEIGIWEPDVSKSKVPKSYVLAKEKLDSGKSPLQIAEESIEGFGVYIRYRSGLNAYFDAMQKKKAIHKDISGYVFNKPFVSKEILKEKALVIYGDSGLGKSCFARAHFTNPLICTHIDDLKGLIIGFHDGVIFDDVHFDHWPVSTCIHLCEVQDTVSIHCRFSNATFPGGVPRIFTVNSKANLWPLDIYGAIDRRCHYLDVGSTKLYDDTRVVSDEDSTTVSFHDSENCNDDVNNNSDPQFVWASRLTTMRDAINAKRRKVAHPRVSPSAPCRNEDVDSEGS